MCGPQPKRGRAAEAGGPGAVSAWDSDASSPSSSGGRGAAAAAVGACETAARRVLSHALLLTEVLAFAAGEGPGRLDAARAVSRLWRAAVESPELQRAFLLGRWPGLAPFLRTSLDHRAPTTSAPPPPPPPPPESPLPSAAVPTPLAPFLHFATTPALRRAEDERRLAERFRAAALQIEGPVAIADCLARSDDGESGSFLDRAYALQLTDAARGLPLGEWGRCRAALTWGGVALWEARLGLDEIERVGAGPGPGAKEMQTGGCCSCSGARHGREEAKAAAAAEQGEIQEGEERWEVSCSGAGGFRPRIAGVVEGLEHVEGDEDDDDEEEEEKEEKDGSAEVCFELVLGCSLPGAADHAGEEDEDEEERLHAAVPRRVWRAEMLLCAEDGAWALPSPYAVLKALALCDTAARQQREEAASGLRRLRARFRDAWVLVEEFASAPAQGQGQGQGQGEQQQQQQQQQHQHQQPGSPARGKGHAPAPATPVLTRFHLSPLLHTGAGEGAVPALFAAAAAAVAAGGIAAPPPLLLPTTAPMAAASEGKDSSRYHRVWLLDVRTGRPVVLAEGGPMGARRQLLLPVGHALGWRVAEEEASKGGGVRLVPYVMGPDPSWAAVVEERALPPFAGLKDVLACLEVCVAGVPADGTGACVVGGEGVRMVV